MRYFRKIANGVDVKSLLVALERQPELWNQYALRRVFPGSPQGQVDDIWLRFANIPIAHALMSHEQWLAANKSMLMETAAKVLGDYETVDYPALASLPQAKPLIFDLMRMVEGERLGRVLITRLAPGHHIERHFDGGFYARYYDRYHITLQNSLGSIFRVGDETVCMEPGEVWWFDTSVEHEIVNKSSQNRITMIVDIRRHGRVE